MPHSYSTPWTRKDIGFIAGLIGLIFLYFHEILTLQSGFYSGDHRQQHYPWAFFYAEQLKRGMLPWWTSLFGCGFPLLAEGQVGALYLPNFLFYKMFPFDFAYTYNILFHYCLGAFFFYAWLRQQGLVAICAFGGTIIYLFGTAQGGYYYNIISLKTLIWFPVSLFLIHQIFDGQRSLRGFLLLAFVFALQWTAGYLQYAVYSVFFAGLAALAYAARLVRQKKPWEAVKGLGFALISVLISFLLAFPQLGATLELSQFSNRFDFPVEFAFVGSLNPLAIATLFFPHWDGFLSAEIYFGSLGLFFLICSFSNKKSFQFWYFFAGFLLAVTLALGKWNPLFHGAVVWSGFSSFRVPTKFLYFAGMFGAALCARGMQHWLITERTAGKCRLEGAWRLITFAAVLGWWASYQFFNRFSSMIYEWGKTYLSKHYQQSVLHPHSMEVYEQKLRATIEMIRATLSHSDGFNLKFIFWMIGTMVALLIVKRMSWSQTRRFAVLLVLLFLNLWTFGDTSIRGNIREKSFLLGPEPSVATYLSGQTGRVHRVFKTVESADSLAVVPHSHMLKSIALTGAYSPLVPKAYYEWMRDLGDVNDSNVLVVSSKEKFLAASEKLNFINAAWVLSDHPFSFDHYPLVMENSGSWLYRNPEARSRAMFYPQDSGQPAVALSFLDQSNSLKFDVQTDSAGTVSLSDFFYPGWQAYLNGTDAPVEKCHAIFRCVSIPSAGNWSVEMRYEPRWRNWIPLSLALLLFGVAMLGVESRWHQRKSARVNG